jgi:hypothetical protein
MLPFPLDPFSCIQVLTLQIGHRVGNSFYPHYTLTFQAKLLPLWTLSLSHSGMTSLTRLFLCGDALLFLHHLAMTPSLSHHSAKMSSLLSWGSDMLLQVITIKGHTFHTTHKSLNMMKREPPKGGCPVWLRVRYKGYQALTSALVLSPLLAWTPPHTPSAGSDTLFWTFLHCCCALIPSPFHGPFSHPTWC